jgi:DNA polymerase-3 subunit epsilon
VSRAVTDGCGCFPSGHHYPGIAHLLRAVIKGLCEEWEAEHPWHELPIALLDVETTGRDASSDRVVELGIVIGRAGEVVAHYNWLIHPGIPIPAEVSAIHGIKDEDVKDSPRFEHIAAEVLQVLTGCVPAAYNAAFDRAFLHNELSRAGHASVADGSTASGAVPALRRDVEWFDPLVWAREIQREERSKALGEVAQRLGIALENAHRARDDAEAALRILYHLGKDTRVPGGYGAMVQEQRRLALLHADERRRWAGSRG